MSAVAMAKQGRQTRKPAALTAARSRGTRRPLRYAPHTTAFNHTALKSRLSLTASPRLTRRDSG